MVNIFLIKQQLSPEQIKVLDDVLFKREDTLIAYKILLKQYGDTKRKIKAIEKRLIVLMQQLPENDFAPRSIEGEMWSIENKYKAIDKAIKNYKEQMKYFDHFIGLPNFRMFYPEREHDWHISGMKHHLVWANHHIEQGLDAIRITKRYFKNISGTFKSVADRLKFQKSLQARALKTMTEAPTTG